MAAMMTSLVTSRCRAMNAQIEIRIYAVKNAPKTSAQFPNKGVSSK